jgi:hypothetical protein
MAELIFSTKSLKERKNQLEQEFIPNTVLSGPYQYAIKGQVPPMNE